MSLNSMQQQGGAGATHAAQAPRLQSGGYAAWRPRMEHFLQRAGADGIHTKATTVGMWKQMSD